MISFESATKAVTFLTAVAGLIWVVSILGRAFSALGAGLRRSQVAPREAAERSRALT